MKFSRNRYYIERYIKCINCGGLIYESDAERMREVAGQTYCSDWCVEWAKDREARLAAAAAGQPWRLPQG